MKKPVSFFMALMAMCLCSSSLSASGHLTGVEADAGPLHMQGNAEPSSPGPAMPLPLEEASVEPQIVRMLVLDSMSSEGNLVLMHILHQLQLSLQNDRPHEYDLRSYFNAFCGMGCAEALAALYASANENDAILPRWSSRDLLDFQLGLLTSQQLEERSLLKYRREGAAEPPFDNEAHIVRHLLHTQSPAPFDEAAAPSDMTDLDLLMGSIGLSETNSTEVQKGQLDTGLWYEPLRGKPLYTQVEAYMCPDPIMNRNCERIEFTTSQIQPSFVLSAYAPTLFNLDAAAKNEVQRLTISGPEGGPSVEPERKLGARLLSLVKAYKSSWPAGAFDLNRVKIEVIYLRTEMNKEDASLDLVRQEAQQALDTLKAGMGSERISITPIIVSALDPINAFPACNPPELAQIEQRMRQLNDRVQFIEGGLALHSSEYQLRDFYYNEFKNWAALPRETFLAETVQRALYWKAKTNSYTPERVLRIAHGFPKSKDGIDTFFAALNSPNLFPIRRLELDRCGLSPQALERLFDGLVRSGGRHPAEVVKLSDRGDFLTATHITRFIDAWRESSRQQAERNQKGTRYSMKALEALPPYLPSGVIEHAVVPAAGGIAYEPDSQLLTLENMKVRNADKVTLRQRGPFASNHIEIKDASHCEQPVVKLKR